MSGGVETTRAPALRHLAIRASAGTGKTYQLTNRYLRLLAEGSPAERVLAVTFTRKAAGEIFERLVERLAEAAADETAAEKLAEEVGRPNVRAEAWGALLTALLRAAHRLNVGTLDSVFVRVAQAFSLELNLPPGWSVASALQAEQLRERALAAAMESMDSQALIEAVRLLNRGERRASVAEHVRRMVTGLHGVYLDAPESAAWRWLADNGAGPRAMGGAELAGAIAELRELAIEDDKRLAKATAADAARAATHEWGKFLSTGLPPKLEGDGKYHGKVVPDWLAAVYRPLIDHAKATLLADLDGQNRAAHQLVAAFDEQYHALQRQRRLLGFEDITRQLGLAQLTDRWETLQFRLDARFDHLLLDEFQDTSRQQWRVLRPLAREITAQDPAARSFFCVGDVKQSIYGWRGGEPTIFRELERELPSGIEVDSLALNRRSGPDVIETVNAVFENLSANPAVRNVETEAAAWAAGYERHEAHRASLTGRCELEVADVAPGSGGRAMLLRHAAKRVAALSRRMPSGSIAVLTRSNAAVARMIGELRRLEIPASQEGGNPLTDSPAVSVVLSLLQLADHPSDTAAAYHVGRSPLGPVVGVDPTAGAARLRQRAAEIRGRLVHEGYGPVVEQWAAALAKHSGARNARRLEQLAGLAWAYEPTATLRPSDFVRHVQGEKVEEPSAASVRVMTVHRAKGLQFDAVVLPELDGPMIDNRPDVLIDRPDPIGPIARVSQPGTKEIRALSPTLQEMYEQHLQRAANDALSTMYVALTRAARGLYLIIPPCQKQAKQMPATFAGLALAALVGDEPPKEPGLAWARGESAWWEWAEEDGEMAPRGEAPSQEPGAMAEGGDASGAARVEAERPARIELASWRGRRRMLPRQSPSRLEGAGRIDVAGLLQPGRRAAVARGSLMHAWCERIEWLDEGAPDAATLREAAAGMALAGGELEPLLERFQAMVDQPALRAALSRSRYTEAAEGATALSVERERPFVVRDDGQLLQGTFDRLVVVRGGGRAVYAEVLDFKTDTDPPEAVAERYRPQLAAYRRAAARMLGLSREAVDAAMVLLPHGRVQTI